jgi:hypothetical protein
MASPDQPRLVEMGPVRDVWVDGIGKIEPLGGGTYRVVLYRVHQPLDGQGPVEHDVVVAILANMPALESAAATLRALLPDDAERMRTLM